MPAAGAKTTYTNIDPDLRKARSRWVVAVRVMASGRGKGSRSLVAVASPHCISVLRGEFIVS